MSDARTLYAAQFFGFTPETFMLRVYMAFQESLLLAVVNMEAALVQRFSATDPARIRRRVEKFLAFFKDYIEALFLGMEAVLRQAVLGIPDNVLLPEDQPQEKAGEASSREGLRELQEEARQLEARLRAERRAAEALEAELKEQRLVRAQLEGLRKWLRGLEEAGREDGGSGSLREGVQALARAALQLRDVVRAAEGKLAALEPQ